MQDFHHNRARALLKDAEELFSKEAVDHAVTAMAETLNTRFNQPDAEAFPLVLGVMGGAVVFTGNLLPQLTFPLEFDYIHVSRYGDEDRGGEVVWKVVPRSKLLSTRTVPPCASAQALTSARPRPQPTERTSPWWVRW